MSRSPEPPTPPAQPGSPHDDVHDPSVPGAEAVEAEVAALEREERVRRQLDQRLAVGPRVVQEDGQLQARDPLHQHLLAQVHTVELGQQGWFQRLVWGKIGRNKEQGTRYELGIGTKA